MSKIGTLLDKWLFAPSRYLDYHGNIVGAGYLRNLFSQPEIKITTLAFVGLAAAVSATDDKELKKSFALAAVLSAPAFVTTSRRSERNIYFDTQPEDWQPIPHDILTSLYKQKTFMPYTAPPVIATINTVTGSLAYWGVGASLPATAMFLGISTVGLGSKAFAMWWHADRALKGEWNVLTTPPEIKKTQIHRVPDTPILAPS